MQVQRLGVTTLCENPAHRLRQAMELIGSVDLLRGPARYQDSQAELFWEVRAGASQALRWDETAVCAPLFSPDSSEHGAAWNPESSSHSDQSSFLSSHISHGNVPFLPRWGWGKYPPVLRGAIRLVRPPRGALCMLGKAGCAVPTASEGMYRDIV